MLNTVQRCFTSKQPSSVTGRNVAHGRRTAVERAFLAADLHLGRVNLVKPTVKQVAAMLTVSQAYVAAAKAVAHDERGRDAVLAGRVPLLVASWSESLAERYLRASPAERVNLTQTAGVDAIWDDLIVPSL